VQNQTSPLILSFGVSDPVGAIGIQADLATFSALGCHGLSVSTALLIGDTARVEDVQELEPDWVSDQARVLLEDMAVDAIKIGALGGIEHVTAIAEIVSDYPDVPLILDPFISALPDQGLDSEDMLMALRQLLIPQTTVLLLSPDELGRLAETWRDASPEDTVQADVDYLLELGCEYVLLTGTPAGEGAQAGERANTLFGADGVIRHDPWLHLPGSFTGAGGTLSAAVTALLANPSAIPADGAGASGDAEGDEGEDDSEDSDVAVAVGAAQDYAAGTLAHAQRFGMGRLVPNRFYRLLPVQAQ
jgi:hydroxymethylpyrimidine/phosphomethylpyrimidine kinase